MLKACFINNNGVAFEIGAVERQLPLDRMASEILKLTALERVERH